MRRREYYWSLYHATEKNQLDNLRTDQVEAVYSAVPERNRGEWVIWRDGLDAWKPFADFPQLLVSLRKADDVPVETPPKPRFDSDDAKEITKSFNLDPSIGQDSLTSMGLSIDESGVAEDRSSARFNQKIDVRIISGDRAHANSTLNISMKGMQFRSPLPQGLPRFFTVEIKKGGRTIPVVCSEIRNADGSPSTRVKIEVNDYADALFTLLLSSAI